MKILAVEFSSEQRSVAIAVDGRVVASASEIATRATHAFGLIERALGEAKLEREEIEGIAVGIGPGSYTGIRSALALAQGWQLAAGVKLVGIASVECLAAGAQAAGWFGVVNVVIDAQRNEFYLARYEVGGSGYREVGELRLVRADEVGLRANVGEIIVGPEVTRWFGGGKILFPEARVLGELAEGRNNFVSGEKLEPIYLRETNFVKAPPLRVLPGEKG